MTSLSPHDVAAAHVDGDVATRCIEVPFGASYLFQPKNRRFTARGTSASER